MKKLESLSSFEARELNQMQMSKIKGGYYAGTATSAGTLCVHPARSASGCMSYSKDVVYEDGSATYTPSNGTAANSDVDNPC